MHKFLRSVGFSTYQKRKDINRLLDVLAQEATQKRLIQLDPESNLCEIRTEVAPGMGIAMVGEMNDLDEFERDYYYPYLTGIDASSDADCSLQRHTDHESYAGLLDENRVGLSLIFFVDNGFEYIDRCKNRASRRVESVNLTGLAIEGKILLPIKKNTQQADRARSASRDHSSLIEAAKNGDQEAMETLTIEDLDLYSQISRRIQREDVYSIVDSTFMPNGVECDQYSILGEIFRVDEKVNRLTGEKVYDLTVDCNSIVFHVCIAAKDLLGEPAPGRRFKGQIWMQGHVNFAAQN
jgi:hypothetical protein